MVHFGDGITLLCGTKFDQNAADTACIQLGYTGALSYTISMPIVAEILISGLMVLIVEIMLTVAWTAASVTHGHSLLFSVTLAMLSP